MTSKKLQGKHFKNCTITKKKFYQKKKLLENLNIKLNLNLKNKSIKIRFILIKIIYL